MMVFNDLFVVNFEHFDKYFHNKRDDEFLEILKN